MSAIAGFFQFGGAPVEPGQIAMMVSAMASRGPDGERHWAMGSVAMGQCMLCTTPESLEEVQPLLNEDESLVLVMDGRVDNLEELRRDLLGRGARLRDRSDAELVLRAYEAWGEDCPKRIIGEFVFFVWDKRRNHFFGARDAAGSRHIYYYMGEGWFAFASEIKGLLALGLIEARLNETRLLDYLIVEFDRLDDVGTFYEGINRMPAGHAMSVRDGALRSWRYWNPGELPARPFGSLEECAEAFLEQLRVAIKCRLRSNGQVGAMLSGGLDSSSVVGLISKEFRGELEYPLKTFSLIREDRVNCLDWRNVQEMIKDDWLDATFLSSDIAPEVCQSYLDRILNIDEPYALSEGFPYSLIYDTAHNSGCRVVLDGGAGDTLFYTPERSLENVFRKRKFSKIPSVLSAYRRHGIKYGIREAAWKTLRTMTPEMMLVIYRLQRDRNKAAKNWPSEMPGSLLHLLNKEVAKKYIENRRELLAKTELKVKLGNDQSEHARNFITAGLSFGYEVYGQIALSNGVEIRSPFSDRRMIEFAIQMPIEAKLSLHWYKHLLRTAMAGILPESVRWRREKHGHPGWVFFERVSSHIELNTPDQWICSRPNDIVGNWIDPLKLERVCEEYARNGDFPTRYSLFKLGLLSRWLGSRPKIMECIRPR